MKNGKKPLKYGIMIFCFLCVAVAAVIFFTRGGDKSDAGETEKLGCDLFIVSENGFSAKDIEKISSLDCVRAAEGICESDTDKGAAISFTAKIDVPELVSGRAPKDETEILVSEKYAKQEKIKLGSLIALDAGACENEYRVVGFVADESGAEKDLHTFYMKLSAFGKDAYTGVLVSLYGTDEEAVSGAREAITALSAECSAERYGYLESLCEKRAEESKKLGDAVLKLMKEALDEAKDALDEAKDELDEEENLRKFADGEAELNDARAELDKAKDKLNDADKKIKDFENEIAKAEKEAADGDKKIADGEKEIAEADELIAETEQEIADADTQLNEYNLELIKTLDELNKTLKELDDAKKSLDSARAELDSAKSDYDSVLAEAGTDYGRIDEAIGNLAEIVKRNPGDIAARVRLETLKRLKVSGEELEKAYDAYYEKEAEYDEAVKACDEARADYSAAGIEFTEKAAELGKAKAELENKKLELESRKRELEDGIKELENARADIRKARSELAKNKSEYLGNMAEYMSKEAEFADKKAELEDKRKQFEDARKEYYDAVSEYEEACRDYEAEKVKREADTEAYRKEAEKVKQTGWVINRKTA